MANSFLYDNTYPIPKEILRHINTKLYSLSDKEGIKRAKNLLKSKSVSYQELKRLKNFFDHFDVEKNNVEQFELAGGQLMRGWVDHMLDTQRDLIKTKEKSLSSVKPDLHHDLSLGKVEIPKIEDINKGVNEDVNGEVTGEVPGKYKSDLQKNALAVIFNPDKKILLLKRAPIVEYWQPNKWALVGGKVENGEDVEEAVKREIEEETGLIIDKFLERFVIQRNPDSVEHIFITIYEGDPYDIKLNDEHTAYEWFSYIEINFINTVPNLKDYINIALNKNYN